MDAQLINSSGKPVRDTTGITVTCEAVAGTILATTAVIEYSSDLQTWVPGTVLTNTSFLLETSDPDPALSHAQR